MIGFRLDANEVIAIGHLMRCIAIANKCRELGEECVFLLAEKKNTDILEVNGFKYCILNIDWKNWDVGIEIVQKCINRFNLKCLVVDSYQVTKKFFAELHGKVKLFYIDDICEKRYNVDAILHYSQWKDENTIESIYENSEVQIYSGMTYVPLREEFSVITEKDDKTKQIMITTGGTDPFHITLNVIKAILTDSFFEEYDICAVLGKMNKDKKSIDNLALKDKRLMIFQNINNMGEIMRKSTVAVSAGGSTVYELFASGVPVVCLGFSDNQIGFGEKLEGHGVAKWAGDVRKDAHLVTDTVILCLKEYLTSDMRSIRQKISNLVDGKGAMRIAKIITDLSAQGKEKI